MNVISKKIDIFNEKIGILTSYLILPVILLTFFTAVTRYALDLSNTSIQELIIYLHALIFTLGAAYTLKNDMHIRIDIFYNKFTKLKKRKVNFYGTMFLLIPTCLLIFMNSLNYVFSSISILESSREAGGLPILYIFKSYILLYSLTLLLQSISELIKNFRDIN